MKRFMLVFLAVTLFPQFGIPQTFSDRSDLLDPVTSNGAIGASAVDFNNDGLVDLYHPGRIYLNTGSGYVDILVSTEIIEGEAVFGAAFGDYNNDGYPDILFEDLAADSRLYRNNRDQTFTLFNAQANLLVRAPAQGAAWADFNNDGLLDLYVNNDLGENQLFKNIGNDQFEDISLSAGVEAVGNSYGTSWGDYNNDGYPDIFIATCNIDPLNSIKHLLRNNGDETFTDVNVIAGVNDSLASWGTVWLDYDNDGDLDLYTVNTAHLPRPATNRLYRNNNNGTFTNVSIAANVDGQDTEDSFGVSAADFDNDGWIDIYVANTSQASRLYRNNRNGTFTDIASVAGLSGIRTQAVAVADMNNDGWIDIFLPDFLGNQLWYNDGGSNNWLKVETRGTGGNYHGISSRVEVYIGTLHQIREVAAGDGFCSQNLDLGVHFGLAGAIKVDTLIIRWPGGVVDRYYNVDVNQELTVVQGEGFNTPPSSFRLLEPGTGTIADGSSDVTFRWHAASDPENAPLTYQLILTGVNGDTLITTSDTTITLSAATFADKTYCRWTADVSDERSTVASHEVFLFSNSGCEDGGFWSQELTAGIGNPNGSSYSANWIDYDNNETLDLYIGDGGGQNLLYKNLGNGTFEETSAGALTSDISFQRSSAWGDYNNDGIYDVLLVNSSEANYLYRGTGTEFERIFVSSDLTSSPGAWRMGSWVDVENDGDLDIFISQASDFATNAMYRNDGNNAFVRITSGSIVTDQAFSYGLAWGDYNNDGFQDLLVAQAENNGLYKNNGDWTFEKVLNSVVATDVFFTTSASWNDIDNDGDLDLFAGGFGSDPNRLYRNTGSGFFVAVKNDPVVLEEISTFSHSFGDMDNDGDLDLLVCGNSFSSLFFNNGHGQFEKVELGLLRTTGMRGAVMGDYDRDGDLDLFLIDDVRDNVLLQNVGNDNNWVNIRCIGTTSNTSAIGTRIELQAHIDGGPSRQMREISSQTAFHSQSSFQAAFGLNDATQIDSLIIRWPSGQVEIATGLAVNEFYTATEGQGIMTNIHVPEVTADAFALHQNYPNPFNPQTAIMYQIPKRGHVTLGIYNALGQQVRLLVNQVQAAGMHTAFWDGRGKNGKKASSGVYFYRLQSDNLIRSEKMILAR